MTGPLIHQPLSAKLRVDQQRMRAHDVRVLRQQMAKHSERLNALAARGAKRLQTRAASQDARP